MIHKIHGELIVDDFGMVTSRFERVLPSPAARVSRNRYLPFAADPGDTRLHGYSRCKPYEWL